MSHPKSDLEQIGAAARKSLSQNFLTSPHWAQKLVEATLANRAAKAIWEIGPGLGVLTSLLAKETSHPITVFEFDRKLAANLRENFPSVQVIQGDFLRTPLEPLFGEKIALLSNLPYHLSSPILFLLLEHRAHFVQLVITFQKEFARRLIAAPRTPDYGGLSVLCQNCFSMTSLGVIPCGAFYPVPKVESQVIRFEPLAKLSVSFELLQKVTRTAFAHRRKKLSSNLKDSFPAAKVQETLNSLKIAPMARPEELSPSLYLDLTKCLV